MSVGDSTKEFILIHALGRGRLLELSRGDINPLKTIFFARWEAIESSGESFVHTSRQMCFQQKPNRRPPHITGRRVRTVHQGRVGVRNELGTFRVHDAVVDFVERSMWSTINHAGRV